MARGKTIVPTFPRSTRCDIQTPLACGDSGLHTSQSLEECQLDTNTECRKVGTWKIRGAEPR